MMVHMELPSPTGSEISAHNYSQRLSREIRACMARQEMSQQALAEAIGVSRTTLGQKLAGRTEFTVGEVDAIAQQFGISVSELLDRAEAA